MKKALILLFCMLPAYIHAQQIMYPKASDIAILNYDSFYLNWMKQGRKPFAGKFNEKDIHITTRLLIGSIENYNNSSHTRIKSLISMSGFIIFNNSYICQFVPYLSSTGAKEVFVNCVSKDRVSNYDWHKKLIIAEGGGNGYFRVIINLDDRTFRNFWVNAPM
jgi:hypothetical protein